MKYVFAIAICLAVGISSSFFTIADVKTWFVTINKPSWNPPSYLFAPVWTTLYVLMGIAWGIIWNSNTIEKPRAMQLFIIQLALNFFWSIIFFGIHNISLALFDIIALWVMILLTIFIFGRINKNAAWLLVPYISWVSFATLLNFAIWQLN